MSHVTHMNESCHTSEWVVSHIYMSHVTRINESCHECKWVVSHTWMCHVTHLNPIGVALGVGRWLHLNICIYIYIHTYIYIVYVYIWGGGVGFMRAQHKSRTHARSWQISFILQLEILQHTAAHCNTLKYTAAQRTTLHQHKHTHLLSRFHFLVKRSFLFVLRLYLRLPCHA